jgi:integrase
MVRHCREDAVSERVFERLIAGTYQMDKYYGLQCRFALLVLGRCGFRSSELAHLKEDWVDWREKLVSIPAYQQCDCGSCRQSKEQMVDVRDEECSIDDFDSWTPKTEAGIRSIPIDFEPRIEIVFEDFFDKFDEWPHSQQAVNRRINRVAEQIDYDGRLYPHALRATAASYHVYNDISPISLQSVMGWANLSTAMVYIKNDAQATAKEIRRIHS